MLLFSFSKEEALLNKFKETYSREPKVCNYVCYWITWKHYKHSNITNTVRYCTCLLFRKSEQILVFHSTMKISFFKTMPLNVHMQWCYHGKWLTTVSISVWQLHACLQTERPAGGNGEMLRFWWWVVLSKKQLSFWMQFEVTRLF
jgi:hypothetical protein